MGKITAVTETGDSRTVNDIDHDGVVDDSDHGDDVLHKQLGSSSQKCHRWALRKFEAWLQQKQIHVDFATVEETHLAELLRIFYAEVRMEDGDLYNPTTMYSLRMGLQRHIFMATNRLVDILTRPAFNEANRTHKKMCQRWAVTGIKKPTLLINDEDLAKLRNYFLQYASDPVTLQHTFWFLTSYCFARQGVKTGRLSLRCLNKDSFVLKRDDAAGGVEYITEQAAAETGFGSFGGGKKDNSSASPSETRAFGVEIDGTQISLVDVYKLYMSKLCPENEVLFQRPLPFFRESKNCPWYGDKVVGKNTLARLMATICHRCGLSQAYTNYSVKSTALSIVQKQNWENPTISNLTRPPVQQLLQRGNTVMPTYLIINQHAVENVVRMPP